MFLSDNVGQKKYTARQTPANRGQKRVQPTARVVREEEKMTTQKITIRLPKELIRSVDTFIDLGEFASRSEAIRRALKRFIEEMAMDYTKKAESWRKLQELQTLAKEIGDIRQ